MEDNIKDIIARIKQQPKHGMAKEKSIGTQVTDDAASIASSFDTAFSVMEKAGRNMTRTFKDVYESMQTLHSGEAAAVTGIQKLIGVYQELSKILTDQADQATKLFQRNNQLGKTFGLSATAAQKYGFHLDKIAGSFEKMTIGRSNIEKYIKGLKGIMGVQALNVKNEEKYGKKLLLTQRYMTDIIGLSEDAAEEMRYYNAMAAGNKDMQQRLYLEREAADLIGAQLGLQKGSNEQTAIQQEIMESIGKLGAEVQMQYGRYPATLGLAVMKAKQLGISMQDLNKTGTTLLSIESSVGDELEYQLLSGRRLVDTQGRSLTNMYREAALQGNSNKQADIMANILDTQGDSIKDNMLARQQLAKTLGMEEDTLARMLQKRKLLSDIGAKSLFGKTGADLEKELKELQKNQEISQEQFEAIMESDDTRDIQTRIVEAVENIEARGIVAQFKDQDAFVESFANVSKQLNTAAESFKNKMLAPADEAGLGGGFFLVVQDMKNAVGEVNNFRTTVSALDGVITDMIQQIPIWGNKLSGLQKQFSDTALGALGQNLKSMTVNSAEVVNVVDDGGKQDDAIIMNDGIVRFNPRDKFMQVNDSTMIAGTNVDGNRRLARKLSGGGITDQQISKLAYSIAMSLKQTLPSVKLQVTTDPLFAANKLNKGRYS